MCLLDSTSIFKTLSRHLAVISFFVFIMFSLKPATPLFSSSEPIASTKPKIEDLYRFSVQNDESGKALKLICPAQAYPRPVFK